MRNTKKLQPELDRKSFRKWPARLKKNGKAEAFCQKAEETQKLKEILPAKSWRETGVSEQKLLNYGWEALHLKLLGCVVLVVSKDGIKKGAVCSGTVHAARPHPRANQQPDTKARVKSFPHKNVFGLESTNRSMTQKAPEAKKLKKISFLRNSFS